MMTVAMGLSVVQVEYQLCFVDRGFLRLERRRRDSGC
jgi:hypothetical protein